MNLKTEKYVVQEKNLIFQNCTKMSFDHPICEVIDFPDVVVVMLNVSPAQICNENVFGVSYDGDKLWQIEKKSHVYKNSSYTGLFKKGENVVLSNWDGLELTVSPITGKVLSERYGK